MTDTKAERQPPSEPPNVAVGFAGDEIEDLAAEIVCLNPSEANSLASYVESMVVPHSGRTTGGERFQYSSNNSNVGDLREISGTHDQRRIH